VVAAQGVREDTRRAGKDVPCLQGSSERDINYRLPVVDAIVGPSLDPGSSPGASTNVT